MNTKHPNAGLQKIDLNGHPIEVGGKLFCILMPIIAQASTTMTKKQMLELYAGIVTAAYLSVEAEAGKQDANEMLDTVTSQLKALPSPSASAPANNIH